MNKPGNTKLPDFIFTGDHRDNSPANIAMFDFAATIAESYSLGFTDINLEDALDNVADIPHAMLLRRNGNGKTNGQFMLEYVTQLGEGSPNARNVESIIAALNDKIKEAEARGQVSEPDGGKTITATFRELRGDFGSVSNSRGM